MARQNILCRRGTININMACPCLASRSKSKVSFLPNHRHVSNPTSVFNKQRWHHNRHRLDRLSAESKTELPLDLDPSELVGSLLDAVRDTDGGNTLKPEEKKLVNSAISTLSALGKTQEPRPLVNPLIYGNYNVAYTASPDNDAPAGGRFRTKLGRTLFQTTGVYQSVLEPDIVINKVSFNALGLIPGYVGLRGKLVGIGEGQDTVRVFFEPPVLSFADAATFRIGPPSKVVLSTTYLDERIRLGRGGFGSLFVFTRGGPADTAAMDKVGLEPQALVPKLIVAAVLAGILTSCIAAFTTGNPFLQVAATVVGVLSAGLSFILIRGGLMRRNSDDDMPPPEPLAAPTPAPAPAPASG